MAAAPSDTGSFPTAAPCAQAAGLRGVVRSYNGSKGFGFINGHGTYSDVMFSRHELPEDAREVRGKFLEGREVEFDANISLDGRAKATRLAIPDSEDVFLPGMVKSFSEKNGYGFVSSSSIKNEDVHFSKSDLPPLTHGVNLKGALVVFQKQKQADGKLRVTKILFQTARIAERFKVSSDFDESSQTAYQPTLGGRVTGIVKSFSEKNGYGFIRIPGQPADIIFGKSDVAGGSIPAGSTVHFLLAMSQDGRVRAKQVKVIAAAPVGSVNGKNVGTAQKGYSQRMEGNPAYPATTSGIRLTGIIKSFNPSKGFGFITSLGVTGDIFFMKSNLPPEAQNQNLPGLAVEYELMHTSDGNMRASGITLVAT